MITIPVLILWRVHISLKRKLALGGILTLGIFMIICSIVRISAANIKNGQVDTTWVLLWLEIEGCVAVIVVSISAFRTLFTSHRSSTDQMERRHLNEKPTRRMQYEDTRTMPSYPPRTLQYSTMPSRYITTQTVSNQNHPRGEGAESDSSVNETLPIEGPGIVIRHDIHQESVRTSEVLD